uniref:Uncharacterized protein n=1 Tax=Faecalibaculum rodentium TaxID=1702221 RepID=A0A140DX53_9FIRM|nr:hypothetical protein AALO17_20960 [Faecalibaculum rodentium]
MPLAARCFMMGQPSPVNDSQSACPGSGVALTVYRNNNRKAKT